MRPLSVLAVGLTLLTAACDLAPHYVPPAMRVPAAYQGSAAWPLARPQDTKLPQDWWTLFHNDPLDQLEPKVKTSNPDLAASLQALQQARDLAVEAGSGLAPSVSVGNNYDVYRQSNRKPLRRGGPGQYTDNVTDIAAQWEIDLWDRIRNGMKAQKKSAEAQAAYVAGLTLSLQAELAHDYIVLRSLDQEIAIYRGAITYYRNGVEITQLRLEHKIASALDVDQAQNQLATTQAQLADLIGQRDVMQHAIALLVGENPSGFTLPPQDHVAMELPHVPIGLPSTLLERRPDVAEAERGMQAANAQIGVAKAAFYPSISLNAASGFENDGLALPSLPSAIWSVGSSIALPLFENGLRTAVLQYQRAGYEKTRDQYRSTVLAAFGDVEDQLSRGRWLTEQASQYHQATTFALAGQNLATQLYTGGASDYLNVVVQEGYALSAQRAELQANTAELTNRVDLIKSLGGGWDARLLPDDDHILAKGTGMIVH